MTMIVSVECPSCATAFPVDPDKVPEGGARTECTVCASPFRVDASAWLAAESEAPWASPSGIEDLGGGEPWSSEGPDEPEAGAPEEDSFGELSELADLDAVDPIGAGEVEDAEAELAEPEAELSEPEAGFAEPEAEFAEPEAEEELPEAAGDELLTSSPFGETHAAVHTSEEPTADDFHAVHEDLAEAPTADDFQPVHEDLGEAPTADDVHAVHEDLAEAPTEEAASEAFGTLAELDVPESASEDAEPDPWSPAASDSEELPQTGELVTDQWSELMDGEVDEGAEPSADWSDDDGEAWVVEMDESADFTMGEIEVERLDTVEEHVRAAQEDPELTGPAEGLDPNEVPTAEVGGFEDFMTGGEVVLPEDALEAGGSGLDLEGDGVEGPVADAASPSWDLDPGAIPEVSEAPSEPEGGEGMASAFQFGRRDPHDKARRLARVLVSDMITYNPERHAQAVQNGSIRADFEEEIEKSWAEYVEQVGPEIAESTDYWRDALNDILAGDDTLF